MMLSGRPVLVALGVTAFLLLALFSEYFYENVIQSEASLEAEYARLQQRLAELEQRERLWQTASPNATRIVELEQRELQWQERERQWKLTQPAAPSASTALASAGPAPDPREAWFEKEMEDWVAYHQQVYEGKLPRRIVYCGQYKFGLGNRIQITVSCALYAWFTRRALAMYLPFAGMKEKDARVRMDLNVTKEEKNDQSLRLSSDNFMCYDLRRDPDDKLEVVHVRGADGYDFFGSIMWYNPKHDLLKKLPNNFYQIVFRKIFEPTEQFQTKIDNFKRQSLGRYNIALHLRLQKRGPDINMQLPIQPMDITVQTARTLENMQWRVPPEDVVWLVATENLTLITDLQAQYGTKKVVYWPFDENHRDDMDGLLTWWALGECDEVITTDTSSYATNAAARTGKTPVMCNAGGWCARKLSPQPTQLEPQDTQPRCLGLYTSVDNWPGWFYKYYGRRRTKPVFMAKSKEQVANATRDGVATLDFYKSRYSECMGKLGEM